MMIHCVPHRSHLPSSLGGAQLHCFQTETVRVTKATIIVFMSKEQKSHLGYDLGFRSVGTWCSVNGTEVFPRFVFILVDAQNGGKVLLVKCAADPVWPERVEGRILPALVWVTLSRQETVHLVEFSHLSQLSNFHVFGLLADVHHSSHLSYKKDNVTFKGHILRQAPQLQRTDVMHV